MPLWRQWKERKSIPTSSMPWKIKICHKSSWDDKHDSETSWNIVETTHPMKNIRRLDAFWKVLYKFIIVFWCGFTWDFHVFESWKTRIFSRNWAAPGIEVVQRFVLWPVRVQHLSCTTKDWNGLKRGSKMKQIWNQLTESNEICQ